MTPKTQEEMTSQTNPTGTEPLSEDMRPEWMLSADEKLAVMRQRHEKQVRVINSPELNDGLRFAQADADIAWLLRHIEVLQAEVAGLNAKLDDVYEAPDGRKFSTLCAFNHYTYVKEVERLSGELATRLSTQQPRVPVEREAINLAIHKVFSAWPMSIDKEAECVIREELVSALLSNPEFEVVKRHG